MAYITIKHDGTEDAVADMVAKASSAYRGWLSELASEKRNKYAEACCLEEYVATTWCISRLVKEDVLDVREFVKSVSGKGF